MLGRDFFSSSFAVAAAATFAYHFRVAKIKFKGTKEKS
jgi:hypothetical protein